VGTGFVSGFESIVFDMMFTPEVYKKPKRAAHRSTVHDGLGRVSRRAESRMRLRAPARCVSAGDSESSNRST
jgi:hypothetical protein